MINSIPPVQGFLLDVTLKAVAHLRTLEQELLAANMTDLSRSVGSAAIDLSAATSKARSVG